MMSLLAAAADDVSVNAVTAAALAVVVALLPQAVKVLYDLRIETQKRAASGIAASNLALVALRAQLDDFDLLHERHLRHRARIAPELLAADPWVQLTPGSYPFDSVGGIDLPRLDFLFAKRPFRRDQQDTFIKVVNAGIMYGTLRHFYIKYDEVASEVHKRLLGASPPIDALSMQTVDAARAVVGPDLILSANDVLEKIEDHFLKSRDFYAGAIVGLRAAAVDAFGDRNLLPFDAEES